MLCCHMCGDKDFSLKPLSLHLVKHLNSLPFFCVDCALTVVIKNLRRSYVVNNVAFITDDQNGHHMKNKNESYHLCGSCGCSFKNFVDIVKHNTKHIKFPAHKCGQCYLIFSRRKQCSTHSHMLDNCICQSCGVICSKKRKTPYYQPLMVHALSEFNTDGRPSKTSPQKAVRFQAFFTLIKVDKSVMAPIFYYSPKMRTRRSKESKNSRQLICKSEPASFSDSLSMNNVSFSQSGSATRPNSGSHRQIIESSPIPLELIYSFPKNDTNSTAMNCVTYQLNSNSATNMICQSEELTGPIIKTEPLDYMDEIITTSYDASRLALLQCSSIEMLPSSGCGAQKILKGNLCTDSFTNQEHIVEAILQNVVTNTNEELVLPIIKSEPKEIMSVDGIFSNYAHQSSLQCYANKIIPFSGNEPVSKDIFSDTIMNTHAGLTLATVKTNPIAFEMSNGILTNYTHQTGVETECNTLEITPFPGDDMHVSENVFTDAVTNQAEKFNLSFIKTEPYETAIARVVSAESTDETYMNLESNSYEITSFSRNNLKLSSERNDIYSTSLCLFEKNQRQSEFCLTNPVAACHASSSPPLFLPRIEQVRSVSCLSQNTELRHIAFTDPCYDHLPVNGIKTEEIMDSSPLVSVPSGGCTRSLNDNTVSCTNFRQAIQEIPTRELVIKLHKLPGYVIDYRSYQMYLFGKSVSNVDNVQKPRTKSTCNMINNVMHIKYIDDDSQEDSSASKGGEFDLTISDRFGHSPNQKQSVVVLHKLPSYVTDFHSYKRYLDLNKQKCPSVYQNDMPLKKKNICNMINSAMHILYIDNDDTQNSNDCHAVPDCDNNDNTACLVNTSNTHFSNGIYKNSVKNYLYGPCDYENHLDNSVYNINRSYKQEGLIKRRRSAIVCNHRMASYDW